MSSRRKGTLFTIWGYTRGDRSLAEELFMPRSKPAREARLLREELREDPICGTITELTVYVRFMVRAAARPRAMNTTVQMMMVLRPSQRLLTRATISSPSSSS